MNSTVNVDLSVYHWLGGLNSTKLLYINTSDKS